ncbi:hypothetical protein LUZ61_012069 [Rhynchospora tenuis]|uniref:GPI mannosyltransferase 1 n=1 Tax=Rhynchospora tenuis TaxID=198213 RepID=A0AAD6A277_9POAL|nr:hypothetical protein LUZ61_012069 [Rhynchospora tenuis]
MAKLDLNRLMLISAILRLILVFYGEWQDAHMEVPYTDVDYLVFSDASAMVASGRSPFERSTYRYSPLLAFLLLPNSWVHRSWGKLLFSSADLLVGLFIDKILKLRGVPENFRVWAVISWLFNPFTFTIGTRGNCEPIVCAVILWIIISLLNGKVLQAAFLYGLIVHFRIYPIIYALPFVLVLSKQQLNSNGKPVLTPWSLKPKPIQVPTKKMGPISHLMGLFTKQTLLFGVISGFTFVFLTSIFFYLYGWEFLNEALLYHLTRTDPRHNFSIYFYHIYLNHQKGFSIGEKVVSFLPQLMVQLALILRFAWDLPFCLFVQTVAFVAFNKVMTAQYFVWFFCLLPLILPWTTLKLRWQGLICIFAWMGSQLHWLMWAYLLEFRGKNVFLPLWMTSLLFLASNTIVLVMIIRHHKYSAVFASLAETDVSKRRKVQ